MKYSKDTHDWLDEMLSEVLHATNVGPDFETWKREHPQAVKALHLTEAATEDPREDQENQK